jgi:hypothetical protein
MPPAKRSVIVGGPFFSIAVSRFIIRGLRFATGEPYPLKWAFDVANAQRRSGLSTRKDLD